MDIWNKQTPLVSVMCPSYNHAPYLCQALDSILMQKTDFPIEILVGEDCSPDNSREILQEYEKKYPNIFQMIYRDKNMGATKNSYDLRMRTKGKYIITLETDDYWTDPLKLQKQADFLESHPEYIGCAHTSEIIDATGNVVTKKHINISRNGRICTLQDFLSEGFIFETAALMHRNIFRDGNDYTILYKAHPLVGDLPLLSILLLRGNVFIMQECMSVYRQVIKPGSTSFCTWEKDNRAKSIEDGMKMLVTLEDYFDGKIKYSIRKQKLLSRYFSEWIRRRPGFTKAGLNYIWNHTSPMVKGRTILFLMGYPIRRLTKNFSKSSVEACLNGR